VDRKVSHLRDLHALRGRPFPSESVWSRHVRSDRLQPVKRRPNAIRNTDDSDNRITPLSVSSVPSVANHLGCGPRPRWVLGVFVVPSSVPIDLQRSLQRPARDPWPSTRTERGWHRLEQPVCAAQETCLVHPIQEKRSFHPVPQTTVSWACGPQLLRSCATRASHCGWATKRHDTTLRIDFDGRMTQARRAVTT
jgi:hypothetical protein